MKLQYPVLMGESESVLRRDSAEHLMNDSEEAAGKRAKLN